MLEESLTGLVTLIAVAGGAALVGRLVRSTARLALRAAEATAATGLADVSARNGDLTAMMERRAAAKEARRDRRGALLLVLLWLLWLVIPVFAGWAREAFALAAVLWLIPNQPLRPRLDIVKQ
ncbi:MAG: hypothetical protein KY464_09610 [Gemmatimonadetes bacterium]|nr:hypothetical protein [Gemmatimonadota bacterium]